MIGLLEAQKNYDCDKGAVLKHTAIRIRGAMLDDTSWRLGSDLFTSTIVSQSGNSSTRRNLKSGPNGCGSCEAVGIRA